jgi:protoporphyrinogen/coproporphyrinogen III oxidase
MPHVAVIGGGITGLVAALRLSQQPGVDVTLLESSERLGGKIQTIDLAGARVELGPDSFLARDDRVLTLSREIGLDAELVEPTSFGAWIYRSGRLTEFPEGTVLGFPSSPSAVWGSRALSRLGKARALIEALRLRPLSGPDVSVGRFARSRFGQEVHDRLVDPLLPRIRAGDLGQMSLAAALPQIDQVARRHRSLLLGLRASEAAIGKARFYAPKQGMHRLIEALGDAVSAIEIRCGSHARSVSREARGYRIDLEAATLVADGVVVTAPSPAAAKLVGAISSDASRILAQIHHGASAVINLIFPEGAVRPPTGGSGVLIPSREQMTLAGCTWSSEKWPALAAPGMQTVRCFLVSGTRDPALALSDRDLVGVVLEELRQVVDVSGEPIATHVTRWDAGLPIYEVGHLERVAAIERSLAHHPRVQLAGASLRGSGIPDCISQAEGAAARLLASLRG